ncbi:MAG: pitrilysin family protein [Spirochaetia bacterium]|nr:pitrilysin family protein [Spirochaetia bacterium]
MINFLELDSGSRLVYEKIEHTEVCSIGLWFLNGSIDENPGEKGYAHFIEHILFKGTASRSTSEIAQAFERIGSNFNAFTEKELTCFYCTFPTKHIKYVIDLLTEIIFKPLFDYKEIKKEKNVIISEINEYLELPEENSYDLFIEKMWLPHPLGYKITGEPEDILNIKKKSLYNYYSERYNPGNLVISAAGYFEEELLVNLLNASIPSYSLIKNPGSITAKRTKPDYKYNYEYFKYPSKQIHLHTGIAFPTPSGMKDYYNLLFFSTIMGESMGSRLYQKLREENGYCYTIYAFRSIYNFYSMWNIYANTIPKFLNNFMEKLEIELKNILINSISISEIADARTHLEGGLLLSQEDMELRMRRLARHYIFSGRCFDFSESMEMLFSVTRDDIDQFINTNLLNKDFNVLIYGDAGKTKYKDYNISIKG